jgi:hypothetical protein
MNIGLKVMSNSYLPKLPNKLQIRNYCFITSNIIWIYQNYIAINYLRKVVDINTLDDSSKGDAE